MEHWYTLHTRPNAEYQVAAVLRQRQLEVFLPEIEVARERSERGQRQPFFPCYLFTRIDLDTVGFSTVQWTPGLRRVVAFDGLPSPVPDRLIELIQGQLLELKSGHQICRFQPGDPVRIVDGPFRDMVAIFDRPVGAAERVQVLLTVLGQLSRMQIEAACLEKVADAEPELTFKRPRRTRGRGRPIHEPIH